MRFMQHVRDSTSGYDPEEDDGEPRPLPTLARSRVFTILLAMAVLIFLAIVPPLINVNRYKRQISTSISRSLGRPVHLDSVTLNLLPLPGFTIENFVVGEDPAFGAEPVIRANEVRATLRVSSLWKRRVEFSRIALTDPSVNLVHRPDGKWNLESILLRASQVTVAPTDQKAAGAAPRFPYIEATGARVNFKRGPLPDGQEKLPFSFTEADFALWLPRPDEWHLRLKARPVRTDTASTATGLLRLEGTLGRAATLDAVPITMSAEWAGAPLGAVSIVFFGRDLGLRGDLSATASVQGTAGRNALDAHLVVAGVRRAEFVPGQTLAVDIRCKAQTLSLFHQIADATCAWPAGSADSGLLLTGSVPDTLHPASALGKATLKNLPASVLLDSLHAASERVSSGLALEGTLDGEVTANEGSGAAGSLRLSHARLGLNALDLPDAAGASKATGAAEGTGVADAAGIGKGRPVVAGDIVGDLVASRLSVQPIPLALGGRDPALLTIAADVNGTSMHLTGGVLRKRLLLLAEALPQFGDGLASALPAALLPADELTPIRVDLTSHRPWLGGQVWTSTQAQPLRRARRRGATGRRR